MRSPAKVLAILDLFNAENPVWTLEQINQTLHYSRTTGYRYLKELVDLGYLQKVAKGLYSLGPKIIQLDYHLRCSDPLLAAGQPEMQALAAATGLDSILSVQFFYERQIIDICRVSVQPEMVLEYGRGRPRPFLTSAAPKVLLACLKPAQLKQIYSEFSEEIASNDMGLDLASFKKNLRAVCKQGYYLSLGELEPEIGAIATPVFSKDTDVLAALALVGPVEKFKAHKIPPLVDRLRQSAASITRHLQQ